MAVHNSKSKKPGFSAGMVTAIVTAFWVIVFALVTIYGIGGINQDDILSQLAPASSQAE